MIAALVMAFVIGGDTPLDDSRQEARAQALMREIRCVVCENEPVSHSTADIAVDMRRQIRTQVAEGVSDDAVRKYFSDRYGDFVLFRPPSNGLGVLIWLFPFALVAVAAAVMGTRALRKKRSMLEPLAEDSPEINSR
jgi:cytochrome c-type biogenesis protein CcmH